nr:hypothetical protein 3 [bacterium]
MTTIQTPIEADVYERIALICKDDDEKINSFVNATLRSAVAERSKPDFEKSINEQIDDTIDEFAELFDLDKTKLQNKRERHYPFPQFRFVLMWVLKNKFMLSLTQSAAPFMLTHSMVVHAGYKIADFYFTDKIWKNRIKTAEHRFGVKLIEENP